MPTVSITFPEEDALLSQSINIFGTASVTNGTLQGVQIRIDSDSWITINAKKTWSYNWNTTNFEDGKHVISARSYDGLRYSSTEMINVTVQNKQEFDNGSVQNNKESENGTSGFEIIIVFLAIMLMFFWKQKRGL
jgi:hypothetical protein